MPWLCHAINNVSVLCYPSEMIQKEHYYVITGTYFNHIEIDTEPNREV